MHNAARIRAKLKAGEASIGSWMQLPDAGVGRIMGEAGYDWVALDLEHGRFAEDRLAGLFHAVAAGGSAPMARLGSVSAYTIKAALDAGAEGVILPMIESAEMMRAALAWAHYPPRGIRGVGYSSANLFGKHLDEGLATADPIVVAQIEHADAVAVIDEIVSVPGLDAVMIGPYDLSASMGTTGQFDHPQFRKAQAAIIAACRAHNVACGLHVVMPEPAQLKTALADGHRFIAYGIDAVFLWKNATAPVMA